MASINSFVEKYNAQPLLAKEFCEPAIPNSSSFLYNDERLGYHRRLEEIAASFARDLALEDAAPFLAAGFLGDRDFPPYFPEAAPINKAERKESYAHALTSSRSRRAYPFIKMHVAWPDRDAMFEAVRDGMDKHSFENRIENVANWEALIESLALVNHVSEQEVSTVLSSVVKETETYEDFCYAAHDLGLEGEKYFSPNEVNMMLYGHGDSISDKEKAAALAQAKENYLNDGHDDFYLLPLADNGYSVSEFAKLPIREEVFSAIEEMRPDIARSIRNKAFREHAEYTEYSSAANSFVSQASLLNSDGKPLPPKHTSRFSEALASANEAFSSVRNNTYWVSLWYEALSGREDLAADPERVEMAVQELPMSLRLQLLNVSQVFIAEAQESPEKEVLALNHLKNFATEPSIDGKSFEFLNVYADDERQGKTVVTGLNVFKDRLGMLPALEKLASQKQSVRQDLDEGIVRMRDNTDEYSEAFEK